MIMPRKKQEVVEEVVEVAETEEVVEVAETEEVVDCSLQAQLASQKKINERLRKK